MLKELRDYREILYVSLSLFSEPEKIGKISPESLHHFFEEIGDKMNVDDVKYLMQTIAEPSNDINITSEETYYIMTKKPADVVRITSLTKNM